jgi:hypothetical protein
MMTTTITDLDDFKALDPFFRIIEKGLDGIADGGHFFDLLAEDVIFDYHQPVHLCTHDHRSQGHSLARLPRPRGGLRRARLAVTLMDGASLASCHVQGWRTSAHAHARSA